MEKSIRGVRTRQGRVNGNVAKNNGMKHGIGLWTVEVDNI